MPTQSRQQGAPAIIVQCLVEALFATSLSQRVDELLSKHAGQALFREQEAALAGDPLAIGTERAVGHQRMHMQVAQQALGPGVEHEREGQHAAESAQVGAERDQSLRRLREQDVGDQPEVAASQAVQGMRNGKNQMHVWHRQQFPVARRYPLLLGAGLALWVMAVSIEAQCPRYLYAY